MYFTVICLYIFFILAASVYEMRISSNISLLRNDFVNNDLLTVRGVNMTPSVAGHVERLQMVVSSNDAFASTAYFAIEAIDEVGNRGSVSNILPITVGEATKFEGIWYICLILGKNKKRGFR